MSNIAGKSYAMNVITPVSSWKVWIKKVIFFAAGTWLFRSSLKGLITLSLIHYAKWVIIKPRQFPRLDKDQPKEKLSYSYMLFFSNFNGSWAQYVTSFSSAIPKGLDLFWFGSTKYPRAVPLEPFNQYILDNQVWTDYYYNAYPLAASNDVKSAKAVKDNLTKFIADVDNCLPQAFQEKYNELLLTLQHDISRMDESPVVSLAEEAIEDRQRCESLLYDYDNDTSKTPSYPIVNLMDRAIKKVSFRRKTL